MTNPIRVRCMPGCLNSSQSQAAPGDYQFVPIWTLISPRSLVTN